MLESTDTLGPSRVVSLTDFSWWPLFEVWVLIPPLKRMPKGKSQARWRGQASDIQIQTGKIKSVALVIARLFLSTSPLRDWSLCADCWKSVINSQEMAFPSIRALLSHVPASPLSLCDYSHPPLITVYNSCNSFQINHGFTTGLPGERRGNADDPAGLQIWKLLLFIWVSLNHLGVQRRAKGFSL